MNAELLDALAHFDIGAEVPAQVNSPEDTQIRNDSPLDTQIRHDGRTRLCVRFENVVEGQRFYVNPRDDRYLTRTSRPLSRCPRFANTLVWVNL
jgi:hypothetical protein